LGKIHPFLPCPPGGVVGVVVTVKEKTLTLGSADAKFEVSVFTFHGLSRILAQDDETRVQFIIGGVAGAGWD